MYKGAIIGFGKIARSNHLPAYNYPGIKDNLEITSAVEPNRLNFEKSREEYPHIRFYKSVDELFKNEKPDFADIAAPPQHHYELLKLFAEKNIHIICEKPFTLNVDEAKDIYSKLAGKEKIFFICHQYKYSPIWKKFKEFVDNIGNRGEAYLQFNVLRTEADPGLQFLSNAWRTHSVSAGGGILADTGVHYLYLAMWILGGIKNVTARLINLNHKNYSSEDTALIILEGEKGIAQISLTWSADKRYNSALGICGSASIFYDNNSRITINANSKKEEYEGPDASDKSHYTSLYAELLKDFFYAVEGKEMKINGIDEAYKSILLLNACYSSAMKGTTIRMDDEK